MKAVLPDALHARPANLFVRVASSFVAAVAVRKGERCADAKNILEVLTLGAAKGETLEITAAGADAEAAVAALATLVERNFDTDLVPETGAAAAPGIAVGPGVVFGAHSPATDVAVAAAAPPSPPLQASALLKSAFLQVESDLEDMVRALPDADAALFEPEIAIVRALEAPVMARVLRGESVEHALGEEVPARGGTAPSGAGATSDLLLDARERLLDALAREGRPNLARRLAEGPEGDVVLVAHELIPSMVAALPRRVTGIVAAQGDVETGMAGVGYASHAAILARGRGIPLLFVASHVAQAISEGEMIVLDTRVSPPRLWTSPSEARMAEANADRAEHLRQLVDEESQAATPLTHLASHGGAPFAVRVNVGTIHDRVPIGSDGIGLVRTELLLSGRARPPGIGEQLATLALVAGKVAAGPIVVRLFDAGGDKPLAWLPAPPDAPDARGIDLLLRHPEVLHDQVVAIARAAAHADVRLLIPLVRDAADVERVRGLAPTSLRIGAMIESPPAVHAAAAIARAADFLCIGTNDLAAFVRGEDRAKATGVAHDPHVLAMIAEVVDAAHREGRVVTVCGEMAGDPESAQILAGLGVDAISVAPSRFAGVRGALGAATAASCRDAARKAMEKERTTS